MTDEELEDKLKIFRLVWMAREQEHLEKMERLYAELKEEIRLLRKELNQPPPDEAS